MSVNKFPDVAYRISAHPSPEGFKATVCKMPCRVTPKAVFTANGRRIAKQDFGHTRIFAETRSSIIMTCWVMSEEEVAPKVAEIERKIAHHLQELFESTKQRIEAMKLPRIIQMTTWDAFERSDKQLPRVPKC